MAEGVETRISLDRRGEFDFAKPQFRAAIRDARLSFAARGLFQFLWDLPAGWQPRPSHLIKMSGAGKDALMRLRRELESVGALAVEAIRLSAEEATAKNATQPARRNPYRGGQVVGSRWVLFSAHLWAVEMPLDADFDEWCEYFQVGSGEKDRETGFPTLGLNGFRQSRQPGNPRLRFTNSEGSSTIEAAGEETKLGDAAAQPTKKKRGDEIVRLGLEIWTEADGLALNELVARYGETRVAEVSATLRPTAGHRAPYVSAAIAAFEEIARREARDAQVAALHNRLARGEQLGDGAAGLARAKAALTRPR